MSFWLPNIVANIITVCIITYKGLIDWLNREQKMRFEIKTAVASVFEIIIFHSFFFRYNFS